MLPKRGMLSIGSLNFQKFLLLQLAVLVPLLGIHHLLAVAILLNIMGEHTIMDLCGISIFLARVLTCLLTFSYECNNSCNLMDMQD